MVSSEYYRQWVAVALAATRRDFAPLDYAVFADSNLDAYGVMVERTQGDTPDTNVSGIHFELTPDGRPAGPAGHDHRSGGTQANI